MTGMVNITVLANCQAPYIARAMELLNPTIRARNVVVFQASADKASQYRTMMETSDFVFHFNVKPGFAVPELEAAKVKALVGERSRTITNLYFRGLHPDLCYVGPMNRRTIGPFGDYHSRAVIAAYRLGLPPAAALKILNTPNFMEALGYRAVFRDSISDLKTRDTELDIGFADQMETLLLGSALPMYTFNHPAPWLILAFARFILESVGLPVDDVPNEILPAWLLNGPVLPVLPTLREWFGLPYSLGRWKPPGTNDWLSTEAAVTLLTQSYATAAPESLRFENDTEFLERFRSVAV